MFRALLALFLLPFVLLFGAGFAALAWRNVVAGWQSGFLPVALGCVVLGWALLLCGSRKPHLR